MHQQLAWYIGGPVVGLCVVLMRWLLNERLGATGAWSDVIALRFGAPGWLLIGLVVGGFVFGLFGTELHGYGWLTATFGSSALIAAILVVCGFLIGYGAKLSGGCTSGNGLSGNAVLSPASLVATATFFGTAIAVSFLIEALT